MDERPIRLDLVHTLHAIRDDAEVNTGSVTIAGRVVATSAVACTLFWAAITAAGASRTPPVERPATISDVGCVDVAGMVWVGDEDPYMIDANGGSGCGQTG